MKASGRARNILLLTLWIVVAPLPVAGQDAQQAQIEKGRVAVTQVCIGCHGAGGGIMRMLQVREHSVDEWRETVYRMIGRGAQVFPDEIEPIAAYLATSGRRGRPLAASPAGEGNAVLTRRCQQCHDVEKAATKPASEDWPAVIDRMITLGASITPAEQKTLIEYLAGLKK